MYTVKQVAEIANISVRTLHYYDEIDLLRPSQIGDNQYRYYDDEALLRLQQILFYREIGLELSQIKDVLDSPNFDLITALKSHRRMIQEKMIRLNHLIDTIDQTITHIQGENKMSKKKLFQAFSDEQQAEYEREARLQYGPEKVNESSRRWKAYTQEQRQAIMEEGERVYLAFNDAMLADKDPHSAEVQELVENWHQHLRNFYEPTLEILRGLGELYTTSPDFSSFFAQIHPNLAEYMQVGIDTYVDGLETEAIRQLIEEDEANKGQE